MLNFPVVGRAVGFRLSQSAVVLEEHERPHDNIHTPRRILGGGRINARRVKRPARDRAIRYRVVTLEHRDLGRPLPGQPVPLVTWPVREVRGFANAVVIDAVVGDVGLVGKGRPGAQHKRILPDGFNRFREVDRHEATRHLGVRFSLGVVLLAAKIAQIPGQQFTATHATTVVVEVVVHDVGIEGVDPRVHIGLVFNDIPHIVLVEHIMVVDQRIGRAGEELEQQRLYFRVVHASNLFGVINVRAL